MCRPRAHMLLGNDDWRAVAALLDRTGTVGLLEMAHLVFVLICCRSMMIGIVAWRFVQAEE